MTRKNKFIKNMLTIFNFVNHKLEAKIIMYVSYYI